MCLVYASDINDHLSKFKRYLHKDKYIDRIIVFAKSPGYKPIVMRINN